MVLILSRKIVILSMSKGLKIISVGFRSLNLSSAFLSKSAVITTTLAFWIYGSNFFQGVNSIILGHEHIQKYNVWLVFFVNINCVFTIVSNCNHIYFAYLQVFGKNIFTVSLSSSMTAAVVNTCITSCNDKRMLVRFFEVGFC